MKTVAKRNRCRASAFTECMRRARPRPLGVNELIEQDAIGLSEQAWTTARSGV